MSNKNSTAPRNANAEMDASWAARASSKKIYLMPNGTRRLIVMNDGKYVVTDHGERVLRSSLRAK